MISKRLSLAFESGVFAAPPDGKIAVFRPVAGQDLSMLPAERVEVVQGFYPDNRAFQAAGYQVAAKPGPACRMAIVFLPRAKALARQLIAQALALSEGLVIVDGQKTDGVDSLLRDCRKRGATVDAVFSKAHGKAFSLAGGDFSDWMASENTVIEAGYVTCAGAFSADGIDRGSALLAAALAPRLGGKIADLGAGWGYLSHQVLKRTDVAECHLIEAEHAALDCARINVTDPRARFHWGDATGFEAAGGFDAIVCNPPFHQGRAADPDLGRAFIGAAARLLKPKGTLWLVANRHLPYEQNLAVAFKEVSEVAGDASFKVFRAARPGSEKR